MSKEDRKYVQGIIQVQRSILELVIVAVALALGINLTSSALPQFFDLSTTVTLVTGLVLCAISMVYVVLRLSPSLSRSAKFEGVLTLHNENQVEEIPRYRFSESMQSHILALTTENKALASIWSQADLGDCFGPDAGPKKRKTEMASRLVREAIEYFALNELSLHLSEYFDSRRQAPAGSVVRVQRRDIPQILLENHFLELFSKPMSEREAFQDHHNDDANEVVFAIGVDGQLFDRFELILPKGSKVSRSGQTLRIRTSRFDFDITPIFEGFSTVLPAEFEELYLGKDFDKVDSLQVGIELSVSFRWWSLLSSRGWDYYKWLDSFTEKIEESFHFEAFLRDVGWTTAHSTAIAIRLLRMDKPHLPSPT